MKRLFTPQGHYTKEAIKKELRFRKFLARWIRRNCKNDQRQDINELLTTATRLEVALFSMDREQRRLRRRP